MSVYFLVCVHLTQLHSNAWDQPSGSRHYNIKFVYGALLLKLFNPASLVFIFVFVQSRGTSSTRLGMTQPGCWQISWSNATTDNLIFYKKPNAVIVYFVCWHKIYSRTHGLASKNSSNNTLITMVSSYHKLSLIKRHIGIIKKTKAWKNYLACLVYINVPVS